MMLIRCSALVVLTAIALPLAAQPAASDHDPHSPTPRENEIFYPLVCIGPRPPDPRLPEDGRSCSKLLGAPNLELLPSNANVAGGDSIDITFNVIAYGSFTKAGADEAYITYNSSMEPE